MKIWKAVLLLAVAAMAVAVVPASGADTDESDVIVLTEKNFDSIVTPEELMLVEFYAPWCGHCKALAPAYAEAATMLKNNDPPIKVAKCDATENRELAGRFGISGYPTMLVMRKGKNSPYTGPRDASGIAAYMRKQVGPAARPLTTDEEITAFRSIDKESKYSVVGFFSKKNTQLYSSFSIVASRLRDRFYFGKVVDAALAEKYGVGEEGLVAFQGFAGGEDVVYSGSTKTKAVEEFITGNALPLVGAFSTEVEALYKARGLPIVKFFTDINFEANPKQARYYMNRLRKTATKYAGQVSVTHVYKKDFEQLVGQLNLADLDWAVFVEHEHKLYSWDEDKFSADGLAQFVGEYLAGDIPEWVRSERPPKDNSGPVKVVTGRTFDELVLDEDKDVLIEFYAPWCGHCKALEPKYKELGKKIQKKYGDTVTIAKLDATANEFPRDQFEVSGYPTIYLSRQGNKKPIRYEGQREVKTMLKWLRKKATSIKKQRKNKKGKKDEL